MLQKHNYQHIVNRFQIAYVYCFPLVRYRWLTQGGMDVEMRQWMCSKILGNLILLTGIKDCFRIAINANEQASHFCVLPSAFLTLDVVLLEIPQANEPS